MHGSPDTIDKIFTSALYQLLTPRKYAKRTVGLNTFRATWFRRFFAKKNSSFLLPYQRPSSSAHCARELFSGSNRSASLIDCTRKKIFCLGVAGFL